jgi:hypothetical protein
VVARSGLWPGVVALANDADLWCVACARTRSGRKAVDAVMAGGPGTEQYTDQEDNPLTVGLYGSEDLHGASCGGCWSSYAIQQGDGRYWRVCEPLTHTLVSAHLRGLVTLGTYLLDEADTCAFAVFDADSEDGLERLAMLAGELRQDGVPTLVEASRRGGHLWVHLAEPTPAHAVRAWLLPYAQGYGLELYPKQDACVSGPGSLIRLPLGIHRRSRGWYPFLATVADGSLVPVGQTVEDCCRWAWASVERVTVPVVAHSLPLVHVALPAGVVGGSPEATGGPDAGHLGDRRGGRGRIRAWCRSHDALAVIGRYVALDRRGVGSCPFKGHHYRGDVRPSFQVFPESEQCWYCYTWQRGGDLFDFLCLYYEVTPQEGWLRLQRREWD